MFDSVFFAVVLFGASSYLLAPHRLHPFQIGFVWVFVVCMDEIFFTLMLQNWQLFDVTDEIDDMFVRLVNLNVVTPVLTLLGLEAATRATRLGARAAIAVATATAMFAVDAYLIRMGVYRTVDGFRWIMIYAEEAFLVVCSFVSLFLISAFMRKDGIGYDPFR